MHTITVTFEDKEFEELKRVKEKIIKLNWHDFILEGKRRIEWEPNPYADGT